MLCPLNGGELQQRVGQDRKQHAQVLAHGLGPAGQVDDEGVVAQAGGGARERRERFDLERLAQQQLGDARRLRPRGQRGAARVEGTGGGLGRREGGRVPRGSGRCEVGRGSLGCSLPLPATPRTTSPPDARTHARARARTHVGARARKRTGLSTTASVASGVTSRGARPVPPVVSSRLQRGSAARSLHSSSSRWIASRSSATVARRASSSVTPPAAPLATNSSTARST